MTNSESENEIEIEVIKEAREKEPVSEPKIQAIEDSGSENGQDSEESSDDDLIATGTVVKEAEILVHPRNGCPIHPFRKTFKEKKVIAKNEKFCEKCFCYICDIEASKCEYWTDEKVRHCNAYHTKEGLWKFIREKYKERKAKKENLLAIKRDLHEQRKRKRPESSKATPPVIDLADLEEKMKRLEEVRAQKESERLKKKEHERQKKIQNQESFTYQTHEAFDSYESTAPPVAGVSLNDTETIPDFAKSQNQKPKIQMKINFGKPAQDSTPLEPEDIDGLTDPSATKRSRQEESSTESPEKLSTALSRVRNPSSKSGEYSDLPNTTVATVPEDQLKPAGSGLTNSSLSHLQQWLSSTKHNAELQLRKAQENFKAIEAPGKSAPFKKLDGIRFKRVYDDKQEESNSRTNELKKFHTSIPFNYNQRGGGPPTRGFIERGRGGPPGRGGIRFDIRGGGQNSRGGPQQGFTFRGNNPRGRFQGHGGPPNRGGPPVRGVPPVHHRGMPQRGFPSRGHQEMRGDSFRGRGQSSRDEFSRGRGIGHSSRGGSGAGYSCGPPNRDSFEEDNRPRYGMAPNPRRGRSSYTSSNMQRGSGSFNRNHVRQEDFSRGDQRDNPSACDARPNSTRNVPRFDDGKIERPMGRSGPQSSAYDQLLQDVDKHREISKKKNWENSKLDRDIEVELRRTQKKSEPVMLGEVRVAKPETFGKW
ncbi:unnamed protein product [Oikopleura dioica]|uniref:Uncharacterized protein n=1 Tax=Oikopleura dioica TaxID=34765 RepID=E4WQP4_OIKDI|nr:unnamed protein product [Oikopleura dioica]